MLRPRRQGLRGLQCFYSAASHATIYPENFRRRLQVWEAEAERQGRLQDDGARRPVRVVMATDGTELTGVAHLSTPWSVSEGLPAYAVAAR